MSEHPPTEAKKSGCACYSTAARNPKSDPQLGTKIIPQRTILDNNDLVALINQAARLARGDPRHASILKSLKRLAERRGHYRPGPRFGDGDFKLRLHVDK